MNILYKTVYSDSAINYCNLQVTDDGYQSDGYHLIVGDGYIMYSKVRYNMPQTEIVIPLPFPNSVRGYFCLDGYSSNAPTILVDELRGTDKPYDFKDGHYKFIDLFFNASIVDLNKQTITFLHILPRSE